MLSKRILSLFGNSLRQEVFACRTSGSSVTPRLCYATAPKWTRTMGCSTSKMDLKKGPTTNPDDEYIEGVVCQDSDIRDNEMKAFELQEIGKVLLVRQNGKLTAVGSKCTHYGAPLETGALGVGHVRCPWHGACFNTTTGDIEDFPGMDSLPCYQVQVENNNVTVRAKRSELKTSKRLKLMCSLDTRESQHMVIIGGGPAAATCVETLRQEGFSGKITMVTKENCLPYDRIKLSKAMDSEIGRLQLRTDSFYKEHNIDILKNTEAVKVDTSKNNVTLGDGQVIGYTKLFVATGSKPLKAPIPGSDLKQVAVLRSIEDAGRVHGYLGPEKEVVVLGASFIAMEVACYCVNKAKKVTVIGRDSVPFRALLGPEVGAAVKAMFEEKGVNFVMNSGMRACIGNEEGVVTHVELVNGDRLNADLVVMGVGSSFCTDYLKESGVTLKNNGAVEVDEFMQTNIENVFAGGDIAHAPVFSSDNEKSTIGHYSLAQSHGRVAALNMLGKKSPLRTVPFFWTMLFGKGIPYAGHGTFNDVLYTGSVPDLKFAAYYLNGDRVVAVSSCAMGTPVVAKYAELRLAGNELYRQDLGVDLLAWAK